MSKYTVTIQDLPSTTFIGIVDKGNWNQIKALIDKHLPVVTKYLSSKLTESNLGTPSVRYCNLGKDGFELYIGYMFDSKVVETNKIEEDSKQQIQKFQVPEGKYAKLVHKGPYEEMYGAWKALEDWDKNKLRRDNQSWSFEKYLNDPKVTKKEELLTEVYWKLKE